MTGRRDRGLTLLEVLVAVVVLGVGVTALERLLTRNVGAIADDERLTHAMLLARALVAEAELAPPEPGHVEGDLAERGPDAAGFRFTRDVARTPHPSLREVRIRVYRDAADPAACELVELVRVPTT